MSLVRLNDLIICEISLRQLQIISIDSENINLKGKKIFQMKRNKQFIYFHNNVYLNLHACFKARSTIKLLFVCS